MIGEFECPFEPTTAAFRFKTRKIELDGKYWLREDSRRLRRKCMLKAVIDEPISEKERRKVIFSCDRCRKVITVKIGPTSRPY